MRFLFDKPLPQTITPTTGSTSLTLNGVAGDAFIGYTLWPKPGNWELVVSKSGKRLGSIVFCVSAGIDVIAPCAN